MTRAARPLHDGSIAKARVAAAFAKNPRITPGELRDQTGIPLGEAIALVEARR